MIPWGAAWEWTRKPLIFRYLRVMNVMVQVTQMWINWPCADILFSTQMVLHQINTTTCTLIPFWVSFKDESLRIAVFAPKSCSCPFNSCNKHTSSCFGMLISLGRFSGRSGILNLVYMENCGETRECTRAPNRLFWTFLSYPGRGSC